MTPWTIAWRGVGDRWRRGRPQTSTEGRAASGVDSHGASADLSGEAPAPVDPLRACLRFIAGHFDRATSEDVLFGGRPRADDALAAEEAANILQMIGLNAVWTPFEPTAAALATYPAIAWRTAGGPVVLVELDATGRLEVWRPETGRSEPVAPVALGEVANGAVLCVRSSLGEADGADRADRNWLARIASAFWRDYAYIVAATCTINLLALASPLFTMNVYDRVLPNKAISTLMVLAIGAGIAMVFDYLLRQARSLLVDGVAKQLDIRVSRSLFEKILNAPVHALDQTTGWMSSRLSEYEQVRDFIGSSTVIYFIDVTFSLVFIAVIAVISPYLAIAPIVVSLTLIGIGYYAQRRINPDVARSDRSSAHRHSLMAEIVAGLDSIKTARAEGEFLRRWNDISVVSISAASDIKRRMAFVSNSSYLLQTIDTVLIVVTGSILFDNGLATMGGIIASVILASRVIGPMGQIALMLARVRQAIAAHANLTTIMTLPDERIDPRACVHRPMTAHDIEFVDVDFRYGADQPLVVKGFNVKIAAGERVAILGRMGSGKTTLGRLLSRLHEPTTGVIRVGKVDLNAYHTQELRKAIGFATNDALIFDGTIRANVALANPNAGDERLLEAAAVSGLDQLTQRLKAGYETRVGERGRLLSSGQRQTLGLARVFMDERCVFMLDDPTSNMDNGSERMFVERLRAYLKPEQTLIVTTHKNALLSIVDRVIIIEGGRIVADGPTQVVLSRVAGGASAPAEKA